MNSERYAERSKKEELHRKISLVRQSCRKFYITSIQQMHQRFSFTDDACSISEMLAPNNARKLKPSSLRILFSRFPILKRKCDITKAEGGWRAQALIPPQSFGCETHCKVMKLSVLDYWRVVCNLEVEGTNSPIKRFHDLNNCISFLLSMPTSNASAERAFSQLKLIKTSMRSSLNDITTSSIMKVKSLLKSLESDSATLNFYSDLISRAFKSKANLAISDILPLTVL